MEGFTIAKAMTIASNHGYQHFTPIAYHVHKKQIMYLKHLLHLCPTTQLYKVIRGYMMQSDTQATYTAAPYLQTIIRTIKYCDLPKLLEDCAYETSVNAHKQRGTEIADHRQNPRPWPQLIVTISKTTIRNKLKEYGKTVFFDEYCRPLLRMDEEGMEGEEQDNHGNRGDTAGEMEEISDESTISTNSGSAWSAYDDLEGELNSLTTAQLRTRLKDEDPDIDSRGRRGVILRRLVRCIREKEELTQQDNQEAQAHNMVTEEEAILGNDRAVVRQESQSNVQAAREFIQSYNIDNGVGEHIIEEQEGLEEAEEHIKEVDNIRGDRNKRKRHRRNKRQRRVTRSVEDAQEAHDSFPSMVSIDTEEGADR
jgi:hypothetical protein